jgi:anion-transporting  ArsA/GET3 family ATPase
MALHFVTGKGGTGKTRTSLLLAKHLNDKNICLSEMTTSIEEEALKIGFEVPSIVRFTREKLGEDFLSTSIRLPFFSSFISGSKIFQNLFQLAPNLYEILLLKSWLELSKKKTLIVDAPSTGHFLSLFEAARAAFTLFDGGSLHRIAEQILESLKSDPITIWVLSIPEKSALDEAEFIEKQIKMNHPTMEIKKILNRRNDFITSEARLAKHLQDLSRERSSREAERIKNRTFDFQIREGGKSL